MSEAVRQRLHSIVEGYVQGVGFRYFVVETALSLGITGWVRNRFDGSVEVLAEGEQKPLNELIQALHRGPRSSRVFNVSEEWQTATGEFSGFRVRPTEG